MNAAGITQRLVEFAAAIVGHIRGGLAYVVIVTNIIMAGFSGTALADASATGSVLIPAMKRQGYHAEFSAAITAAAATIGPIIPPSIPMIIYAVVAEVSVGSLFLAGVIPGLLMGAYLCLVTFFVSRRRGYPVARRSTLRQAWGATRRAIWALMAPVIILGGIVTGVVTATEAGVLAVAYSLFVGFFIHQEWRLRELAADLLPDGRRNRRHHDHRGGQRDHGVAGRQYEDRRRRAGRGHGPHPEPLGDPLADECLLPESWAA